MKAVAKFAETVGMYIKLFDQLLILDRFVVRQIDRL